MPRVSGDSVRKAASIYARSWHWGGVARPGQRLAISPRLLPSLQAVSLRDRHALGCSGLDRFQLESEHFLWLIAMVDTAVLTVKEVAALLRVDEKTVYRLVKKRDLPGFKVAGAWRFKRVDIESWIERQKAAES